MACKRSGVQFPSAPPSCYAARTTARLLRAKPKEAASSSSTVERQRRKPSSPYICRCDWRTGRTHRRFSSVSHRRATDALLISGARLRRSVNQPNPEVHLEPTELTSRELTLMKGLSELPEKPFSFFHG